MFAKELDKIYGSFPETESRFQVLFPNFGFGGIVMKPYDQRTKSAADIQMEASMKSACFA